MSRIDFPLYLVTDRHQTKGRPLVPLLREALTAGVRAIQLREKDLDARAFVELATEVRALTRRRGALLFINDRVDVALAVEADGVHLPGTGMPASVVRRLIGPHRLIGVSAHSVEEAVQAASQGADFVVLGPVYDTPSKRLYGAPIGTNLLGEAVRRCRVPVFAIGGVTAERVAELRAAGVSGFALISAVLSADSIGEAATRLLSAW